MQLLPGAPDSVAEKVMENLSAMKLSPTEMILKGMRPKVSKSDLLANVSPRQCLVHVPTHPRAT